ncbi:uncharacterized protein [Aegilops tauschii subsp. strangulata]|uniref:Uncharacterized protein n=1 Tax=Aegilops tauschii TaxID=37682 RepID=M8BMQ9_AEGTA|nr:uncharacterized protein LOC109736978 isoform X1 [Aegilops tauschii subsp. strangulata]
MDRKESGEKMEKVEVGDGGKKPEEGTKPATAPVCFKKPAGEDTGILETTKDYFKQLKDTSADTHWDCIKNRVRAAGEYISNKTSSVAINLYKDPDFLILAVKVGVTLLVAASVFGRQKVEPEAKEETPGAKPEAAPASGESQ